MNKFEKQLEKWNNGVLRGAQAKLAKALGVSTATTALWTTGKRHPSKGYISQMAELFGLDSYSVLKLFETQPSVLYPDPVSMQKTYFLRDRADDSVYSTYDLLDDSASTEQSNTVQIPFVRHLLPSVPFYHDEDIIEWWSLPRRYAQGAKYLISSQYLGLKDAVSADDLCLIRPGIQLLDQTVTLFTNGKEKYIVCKVVCTAHITEYVSYPALKKIPISTQFYPIGQIIKRIKPL